MSRTQNHRPSIAGITFSAHVSYTAQREVNNLLVDDPQLFTVTFNQELTPLCFPKLKITTTNRGRLLSVGIPLDETREQKTKQGIKQVKTRYPIIIGRLTDEVPTNVRLRTLTEITANLSISPLFSKHLNEYARQKYLKLSKQEVIDDLRAGAIAKRSISNLEEFHAITEELGSVIFTTYSSVLEQISHKTLPQVEMDEFEEVAYNSTFSNLYAFAPFALLTANRMGIEQGFEQLMYGPALYLIGEIFDVVGYVMGECTPHLSNQSNDSFSKGYVALGTHTVSSQSYSRIARELLDHYKRNQILLPEFDSYGNVLQMRNNNRICGNIYADQQARDKHRMDTQSGTYKHAYLRHSEENGDIITAIFSYAIGFITREHYFAVNRTQALVNFEQGETKVANFDSAEEMVAALLWQQKRGRPRKGAAPAPFTLPEIDRNDSKVMEKLAEYENLAKERAAQLVAEENLNLQMSRQVKTPRLDRYVPKYLQRESRLGSDTSHFKKQAAADANYSLSLKELASKGKRIIIDCTTLRTDAQGVQKATTTKESGKNSFANCIKLIVVYNQGVCVPASYRTLKGSTNDNLALQQILEELNSYGHCEVVIIADRGFQGIPNRKKLGNLKIDFVFMTQRTSSLDKAARQLGIQQIMQNLVGTVVPEDPSYHATGVAIEDCLIKIGKVNSEGYQLDDDGQVVLDNDGEPVKFDYSDYCFNYVVSVQGTEAVRKLGSLTGAALADLKAWQTAGLDVSNKPQFCLDVNGKYQVNPEWVMEEIGDSKATAFATSLPIHDAAQIVQHYRERWSIEPFFRALKSIVAGENEALFCHTYEAQCVRIGILILVTSICRFLYEARISEFSLSASDRVKSYQDELANRKGQNATLQNAKKTEGANNVRLQIAKSKMYTCSVSHSGDLEESPQKLKYERVHEPQEMTKYRRSANIPKLTVQYILDKKSKYHPTAPTISKPLEKI